jgi:hypothetical protein
MQYAKILAALDIEIDRLQRARDLLVASPFSDQKPFKRVYSALEKKARGAKVEAAPLVQPEQLAPQVQKIPYREKPRARRTKKSSSALTGITALSSHVSAAPIVVSANEAQKARVREAEQMQSVQFVPETNDRNGERSLDSLIRAFNRGQIPAGLEI